MDIMYSCNCYNCCLLTKCIHVVTHWAVLRTSLFVYFVWISTNFQGWIHFSFVPLSKVLLSSQVCINCIFTFSLAIYAYVYTHACACAHIELDSHITCPYFQNACCAYSHIFIYCRCIFTHIYAYICTGYIYVVTHSAVELPLAHVPVLYKPSGADPPSQNGSFGASEETAPSKLGRWNYCLISTF